MAFLHSMEGFEQFEPVKEKVDRWFVIVRFLAKKIDEKWGKKQQ